DVWVLRPQEAKGMGMFDPGSDCWHVPRVCGTFRERQRHVCQMPLAVLERVVLACTAPGGLVLDPHAGTGTALVGAAEWGRRDVGGGGGGGGLGGEGVGCREAPRRTPPPHSCRPAARRRQGGRPPALASSRRRRGVSQPTSSRNWMASRKHSPISFANGQGASS